MTTNRARAIGEELADTDAQTAELNASLERDDRRRELAGEIAAESYGSDDVEIETAVESVDGGYWVAARVWVYAEDVEDRMSDDPEVECGCGPVAGVLWPWGTAGDDSHDWIERCDECATFPTDVHAASALAAHLGRPYALAFNEGAGRHCPYMDKDSG